MLHIAPLQRLQVERGRNMTEFLLWTGFFLGATWLLGKGLSDWKRLRDPEDDLRRKPKR